MHPGDPGCRPGAPSYRPGYRSWEDRSFTHLTGVGRVLILSHRDELVRQPEKYYGGKVRFGVEKAEEHATDEEVVSASVQSLS